MIMEAYDGGQKKVVVGADRPRLRCSCNWPEATRLPRGLSLVHPHSPFGVIEVSDGCTGCGVCAEACPTGALVLERETTAYPSPSTRLCARPVANVSRGVPKQGTRCCVCSV